MGIAKAALLIMIGNILSRLLGVVREQVIAGIFGATALTDAFTASVRVPAILYDLLIGGMVAAALVPVFSEHIGKKDEAQLWRVASLVLNLLSLLLLGTTLVFILLAPWVMELFASGFAPQTRALSVALVRWVMPSILFMGFAGVFTALLYARQRFALPALSLGAYNAGMIVVVLLFHQPWGVYSLVAGVLVGAFVQAALQLPGLRGFSYSLRLSWAHPEVRRIFRLYTPVALGLVVSAVGIAIDTHLASRTGEGNLAAMRFATTMVQFPLGLVAAAVGFAILPTLSRYGAYLVSLPQRQPSGAPEALPISLESQEPVAVRGPAPLGEPALFPTSSPSTPLSRTPLQDYKETLALGIKMVLLAILPATVGLVVLRVPVIQFLFERGLFDAAATQRTALAFLAYAPGLPAAAVDQLLIFAFYARQNTIVPVLVGVLGVGVYLVVALALLVPLGMPGLALANSAQWIVHVLVMLALLWRTVGGLQGVGLGGTVVKTVVASAAMGSLLVLVAPLLRGLFQGLGDGSLILFLASASVLGALVYGALLLLLGVQELRQVLQMGYAWLEHKRSRG